MDKIELINRITFVRERAKLSARGLSHSCGKTNSYIAIMEQTKSYAPSFESLCEIIDACNTTFEEFFYHDINEYKTDKEIIEILQTATLERKAAALSVLRLK